MSERLTAQEVFDKVVRGLAAQGWAQSLEDGGCAYRGEAGLRCAAGILISDEHYDPIFEGTTADDGHEIQQALAACGVGREHLDLVTALQSAHDNSLDMAAGVRTVGVEFGLAWPGDVPPPEKIGAPE